MTKKHRAIVITVSDKGYRGERADESGPALKTLLERSGYDVVDAFILPDDQDVISGALREIGDSGRASLVLTTGGTGFSPRDRTPEATLDVAERLAPGIAEAMRAGSLAKTDRAMLSRGVAAIRGRTLIVNLPGSPRGATENIEIVLPALRHGLDILTENAGECAVPKQ